MNHLVITINPYGADHSIKLNGKAVSVYSELSNFVKEPVLNWAYRFYEAAEREINDEFRLTVVGNGFAQRLFRDLRTDSCRQYDSQDIPGDTPAAVRWNTAVELAQIYNVDLTACRSLIPIYATFELGEVEEPMVISSADTAVFWLAETEEDIPRNHTAGMVKLAIIPQEEKGNRMTYRKDGVYVWRVESSNITDTIASILEDRCYCQWVVAAAQMLSSANITLTEENALYLQALTAVKPVVTVGAMEPIPLQETMQIPYLWYPPAAQLPKLTAVPVVSGIVEEEEGFLRGVGEGSVDVEFYVQDDPTPFARRKVRVFRENLVKTIESQEEQLHLVVGQSRSLQLRCVPENADDAHQISFCASPEGVVTVDETGMLTALATGQAQITVATTRAQTQICVQVLPALRALSLSEKEVQCYVGNTYPISVKAEPEGAVMPECEWVTSNSRTAVMEVEEDGSLRIRAVGVGDALITCRTKDGMVAAVCSVCVESTFQRQTNQDRNRLVLWGSMALAALFALVGATVLQIIAAAVAAWQIWHLTQTGQQNIIPWSPWFQWTALLLLGHGVLWLILDRFFV